MRDSRLHVVVARQYLSLVKITFLHRSQGYVYLLASQRNGTLYVGVTSDLVRRVWQHKHNLVEGFTKRYGVHRLVYYEVYDDIRDAIIREKRIKKWKRSWKLELIEEANPRWRDIYDELQENSGFLLTQE